MKSLIVYESVIALLVLLSLYTGLSKLMDMPAFRAGMSMQPFPERVNVLLAYMLPYAEIVIAAGLVFRATRCISLYLYFLLMLSFSVYTGLIVAGYFTKRPCGCGGIFRSLNWEVHFFINLFFLLLNAVTIYLARRQKIFMHKQGVS